LSAIDAVPVEETQREVRRIIDACVSFDKDTGNLSEQIDQVVLHPVLGPDHPGRADVPGVPGRVQLGRGADGPDQERRRRTRQPGSVRTWPRARCAA
jgi:hypothetical protein